MKKLIVIAEKEEIGLVNRLELKGIPILVTGVGALNVIEALREVPKDTEIINIGYAGSKNLSVGKFYMVNYSTLYHPNVNYPEQIYKLGDCSMIWCYTVSDFVTDTDKEDCLFDMELAYIMALGFENVTSYKYVSDNTNIEEYRNTNGNGQDL